LTEADPTPALPGGRRYCLIIYGLAGDAEHRALFAETLERLYGGLITHHGFAAENIHVLWSDEPAEDDGAAVRASRGVSTRETIMSTVDSLRQAITGEDTLWVFVIGHTHYDGRYCSLNIDGDDLQQLEFGRLFEDLPAREQVFFITTPASGFYLKPLSAPARIVISATEPDLEVNETFFPHKLAIALAEPPSVEQLDMDRDGQLTMLDVYLFTARETAQEYLIGQLLATEHALIDDTGDGRGTEVQIDFLTEEQGGRLRAGGDLPLITKGDGARARQIILNYQSLPATAPAEEAAP
jgi:hypothetical protein